VNAGDDRVRVVREGVLKVSAEGATALTYTIQMTNKPAPVPVITLAEGSEGQLAGGTLTLETWGQPHLFSATAFDIVVDFGIEDIRVGIGAAGNNNYITISEFGGVPQAGGSAGKSGTGGFIVAYYKNNTLEEVLADPSLPQARLYINVEYVDPPTVTGIVANTEAIGHKAAASFWKAGQKSTSDFVLAKLSDGTTRAYNSNGDGTLLSGKFNENTKGAGTENVSHSGWFPNVNLDGTPATDATLSWTITHTSHFEEEGWTVVITTQKLDANPEQ
jgi:hypothetical protein